MLTLNKTKLVKFAAVLALLGTASFGAMAEWTPVAENSTVTTYVDLSTIRRSGQMVKMWKILDMKSARATPDGTSRTYLSTRSLNEYDCIDERQRILHLSVHNERMGGGSVLHTDTQVGEWSYVAPESVGEASFKAACDKK